MKKLVVKLDLRDDKEKQKAMKVVSTLQGIDSLAIHMNERKMTVIGSVDPVDVVIKLRKFWKTTDIVSVGPAKEEEKKEEPKKEEAKKEEAKEEKKEEAKKEEAKEEKKEEGKKDEMKEPHERMIEELLCSYNPHTNTYYFVQSAEENPNSCSIM